MQFTIATLASLLAAVSALPGDHLATRQTTFTELAVFKDSGCQPQDRTGTVNLVYDQGCQELPAGVISARVDIDIPAGCQITFYKQARCQPGNTIKVPGDQVPHMCFEFGSKQPALSYNTTGANCSPF